MCQFDGRFSNRDLRCMCANVLPRARVDQAGAPPPTIKLHQTQTARGDCRTAQTRTTCGDKTSEYDKQ